MRFGLSLIPHVRVDELADLAAEAEQLGFADIWIPDHYFFRDAFAFLTLAATRTSSVRLGAAVASPFLRHPALLASTTATIDEISEGRAILGIGPGGFEFATQLGTPIARPRTATIEAVGIARRLWSGKPVDTDGQVFQTTRATLPYFAPRDIPVYMAARGPRMLETAAEIADGVITHGISGSHLDFVFERLAQGGTRTTRRRPSTVLMLDCVVDDVQSAYDRLRSACIVMAGGSYADELIELYGLNAEAVAPLRAAVRAGDWTAAEGLVTDQMVDAFCLAGPPERCQAGLQRLADAGVEEVIVSTNAFHDVDAMREGIRTIATALEIGA